jgi:hypothetical protein
MDKRFGGSHLILVRAQVPYKGSWQRILSQKLEEERTLYVLPNNRINSHVNRPDQREDEHRRSRVALWFYKGCNAKPDVVATFAHWFAIWGKTPDKTLPVLIYFSSEFDWYTQSTSTISSVHAATCDQGDNIMATRVARNLYHDPPGKNVLVLNNVHALHGNVYTPLGPAPVAASVSFNLADYVICRGPRLGMRAREYFVDGKCGQRVACLKRVKSNDPAHLIRLQIGASLARPFAMFAERL